MLDYSNLDFEKINLVNNLGLKASWNQKNIVELRNIFPEC